MMKSVPVYFAPPFLGLVEGVPPSQMPEGSAQFIENFIPTQRGVKVRGGTVVKASVSDPVTSLESFEDPIGPKLFAATASAFFDVTTVTGGDPAPQIAGGFTVGKWVSQQIGVAGGEYLIAVNGADRGQIFDGTALRPWVDESVRDLPFNGQISAFAIGETVTGGTSGATGVIEGFKTDGTSGVLYLTGVVGAFISPEGITSASGSASTTAADTLGSSIAITGVDTSSLSAIWNYRSRIFAVEKNTLTAWYLPSGQVGGTAQEVSLAGVFRQGGALLMGATWSLDSGDGADDKCVFISTEGEVAIYSGSDPSNDETWALQGRYNIGKPLGPKGIMQAGGDLLIATDDGIVPLSEAIRKDPAALSLSAVTLNIRDTWRTAQASAQNDVEMHKWSDDQLLLTVFPRRRNMLVANLQTGAWAPQTGWFGSCAVVHNGNGFVGRDDGFVYQINTSGTDDGNVFVARYCGRFADLGAPSNLKAVKMARASFFSAFSVQYSIDIAVDYLVDFGAAPSAIESVVAVWGQFLWGNAVWGAENLVFAAKTDFWRSVSGLGTSIAPTVQITSGSTASLDVEFIGADLIVEAGGVAV